MCESAYWWFDKYKDIYHYFQGTALYNDWTICWLTVIKGMYELYSGILLLLLLLPHSNEYYKYLVHSGVSCHVQRIFGQLLISSVLSGKTSLLKRRRRRKTKSVRPGKITDWPKLVYKVANQHIISFPRTEWFGLKNIEQIIVWPTVSVDGMKMHLYGHCTLEISFILFIYLLI